MNAEAKVHRLNPLQAAKKEQQRRVEVSHQLLTKLLRHELHGVGFVGLPFRLKWQNNVRFILGALAQVLAAWRCTDGWNNVAQLSLAHVKLEVEVV